MSQPQPRRRTAGPEGSVRTTVTLPVELARRLRFKARTNERSVSSIVREALDAYLAGQPPPTLPSFTGVGRSGRTDLSERVEELLPEIIREDLRS
jgi:plasmid stability protein